VQEGDPPRPIENSDQSKSSPTNKVLDYQLGNDLADHKSLKSNSEVQDVDMRGVDWTTKREPNEEEAKVKADDDEESGSAEDDDLQETMS